MKTIMIRTMCLLLAVLLPLSATAAIVPSAGVRTGAYHDYMGFRCPVYRSSDNGFTFDYFIFDQQVTLLQCSPLQSDDTDLIIPAALDGYPVTTLSSGLIPATDRIYTLTLPESVVSIAPDAFAGVNVSAVTVSGQHFFMSERQLMDTDYRVYLTLMKHEIHSVTTEQRANGSFLIKWQDTNPIDSYVLSYRPQSRNILNSLSVENWIQVYGTTSYPMQRILDQLVPGLTHDIQIYPAGCRDEAYTMTLTPPLQQYTAHNTKLKSLYFSIFDASLDNYWDAKSPQRVNNISAAKVLEAYLDDSKEITTVLELTHSKMTSEEEFSLLTVITLPDGSIYTTSEDRFAYLTDYQDGKATSWSFGHKAYGFWDTLYLKKNKTFPAGKYQIDAYINGQFLGSTSFTLK